MRGKEPRTWHASEVFFQRNRLRESAKAREMSRKAEVNALSTSFKQFCEQIFGFTPYSYQLDLEAKFEECQFNAVRWPRQTGKSFIVSALMLKFAIEHPVVRFFPGKEGVGGCR